MFGYNLFNNIATFMFPIFNLLVLREHRNLPYGLMRRWAAKQRDAGRKSFLFNDWLWLIIGVLMTSVIQYIPSWCINRPFGDLVGTGANYIGFLYAVPFILFGVFRLMGLDFKSKMDLITPAYPLALFFSKIGCSCAGCCGGIAWEHGLMNPFTHVHEFPIALLEALVALGLFIYLMIVRRKQTPGTVFPLYLALFCSIRFFTEFLRSDPNILWIFKTYHILCVIGALAGWLEFFIRRHLYKRRNQAASDNPVAAK